MRCWGCRKTVKSGGAWYFTDAPPGRRIGLCEPCHEDSAPSKARREYLVLSKAARSFSGGAVEMPEVVNRKPLDLW